VRVSALENTVENGNVVEGEITQPREQAVGDAITWSLFSGLVCWGATGITGVLSFLGGILISFTIVGAIIGVPLAILGLLLMIFSIPISFVCGILSFPIGLCMSIESIPNEIGDFIIRLVDACVPG
jgi:hypothetical protein